MGTFSLLYRITAVTCLLCGIAFCSSCSRSCDDEIDTSLAGMIASRGHNCHCSFDGIEIQSPYEMQLDLSKTEDGRLVIDVYGKGSVESPMLPSGYATRGWHMGTSPFVVQGDNKEVSFNESITLTFQSYFDGNEKSNEIDAEVHGWIVYSPDPLTRSSESLYSTSDDRPLSFSITVNWSMEGESHVIKLFDIRSDSV